jgi:hypothetical protein
MFLLITDNKTISVVYRALVDKGIKSMKVILERKENCGVSGTVIVRATRCSVSDRTNIAVVTSSLIRILDLLL